MDLCRYTGKKRLTRGLETKKKKTIGEVEGGDLGEGLTSGEGVKLRKMRRRRRGSEKIDENRSVFDIFRAQKETNDKQHKRNTLKRHTHG